MIKNCIVHEIVSTSDHCYLTFEVVDGIYEDSGRGSHSFSKANWEMIRSYFGTIDWRGALRNSSCSDMWAKFKSVVQHSMELYVAISTINQVKSSVLCRPILLGV